ncbi:Clc-like protein [Necator americanus]|uniref:Clc-like protein n=1 Tax=Necator americanus TaxID=51031 RepID=W2SQ09_NECAM|nr:Clc-like protein [Necator americanus]ETN71725.1 Clc-like protein [Necator americanus]
MFNTPYLTGRKSSRIQLNPRTWVMNSGNDAKKFRYATVTEPLHCVYKFDYDKYSGTFDLEDDNSPVGEVNRHKFYGDHFFQKGFFLVPAFLSAVAEGIFFFYSHRADNRFIKGIVGTYEQRVGLAFFLQMGAAFFHFVAFLVAMISTYFSFSRSKDAQDHYSIQRSSRTNVTNIGRSMEFDAPLMYQPQTPQPTTRPPYSKQEEYERHVAEKEPSRLLNFSQREFVERVKHVCER